MTDKLAETLRQRLGVSGWSITDQYAAEVAAAIREKFDIVEKPAPDPVEVLTNELLAVADRASIMSIHERYRGIARHVQKLLDAEWDAAIEAGYEVGSRYHGSIFAIAKLRALKRARP